MKKIYYITFLMAFLLLICIVHKDADYSSCPYGPCENCKLSSCINEDIGDASQNEEIESYDLLCYGSDEYLFTGDTLKIALGGEALSCDLFLIKILPELDTLSKLTNIEIPDQVENDHPHLYGAGWKWTRSFVIEEDMNPGLYVVHMSSGSAQNSWPFVIINERVTSSMQKFAFVLSTNTYHAYNQYRDTSFYKGGPARIISRQRPFLPKKVRWWSYVDENPRNWENQDNHLFAADYALAKWFVRNEYNIDFTTDEYLHKIPNCLDEYTAVIIGPHSEYWSSEMIDRLLQYSNQGGSIFVLGGNSFYWKVCMDDSRQLMECRKDMQTHIFDSTNGGTWSRVDVQRVIKDLSGIFFSASGYGSYAPYKAIQADHWVFDNTTIQNGDLFGLRGLGGKMASGWETDKKRIDWPDDMIHLAQGINPSNSSGGPYYYLRNTHDNNSQLLSWNGDGGASMGIREFDSGGILFNVGSLSFYYSLWIDTQIQQIMHNVANHCIDERLANRRVEFFPIPLYAENNIAIFPNPIYKEASVHLNEGFSLKIYDIRGNQVFESNKKQFTWKPSPDLPGGVYLAIASNGTRKNSKMIQYIKY